MREKARCCSAHRCLLDRWAPGGTHTCAIHIYPGVRNACPPPYSNQPAFPLNALVCTTALARNIIATSTVRLIEPAIVASPIPTHISHACRSVRMRPPWLRIEPRPVDWIAARAIHTAMRPHY